MQLNLFDTDRQLFAVDVPLLARARRRIVGDGIGERNLADECLVLRGNRRELRVARKIQGDVIRHLESAFLAHRLHLADDLADEALLEEFLRERRFKSDRNTAIALAVVALLLRNCDLDILRRDGDIAVCKMQRGNSA